jgi:hypothetical protein
LRLLDVADADVDPGRGEIGDHVPVMPVEEREVAGDDEETACLGSHGALG